MFLTTIDDYRKNFNSIDCYTKGNYFRFYKLVPENILDVINKFGDVEHGGITSDKITELLGIRPSAIRRDLAKMMNRKNTKKYFYRTRNGSFHYIKVCDFDPVEAYIDIKNSDYEKVTLNQVGLKNSTCPEKLICNKELFPNVVNILKKNKKWMTICEISRELGVETKDGKKSITGELKRCLKCTIKFIETNSINEFRLIYKYRKFSINELKEIAHRSFPQDKPHQISGHKLQALNNVSSMRV